MTPQRCQCGLPILWVSSEEEGDVMVNAEPSPSGSIALTGAEPDDLCARSLSVTEAAVAREHGVDLYLHHTPICLKAATSP